MVTITRRIQIFINEDDVGKRKELYQKWREWNMVCQRAANMISSHLFFQRFSQDFFYYTEDFKIKLSNVAKVEDAVLNTSKDNTTYRLLSKYFKGEAPMGMLSAINMNISKTFKSESKDVAFGKKSLRSYRDTIPMPVRKGDISSIEKQKDGNYTFFVYGTSFKTNFGKDLSGNEIIMDRGMNNEYKFCDSSIQFSGKKMFLLAVFQFEKENVKLDIDKEIICRLDPNYPIVIRGNKKDYTIGSKEGYLYRRIQIRNKIKSLQKSLKFSSGGNGRKNKLVALDKYKNTEYNYVNTAMHQYSAELIKYCLNRKAAKIVLENYEEIKEAGKENVCSENNEPLLRSWSFSNLAGKIVYKAAKYGIEVEVPKSKKEEVEYA